MHDNDVEVSLKWLVQLVAVVPAYGHTALPAETLHFDSGRVVGAKCTQVHPALLERNLEIGPAIEALGSPPKEGFLGGRPSSGSCKLPRH